MSLAPPSTEKAVIIASKPARLSYGGDALQTMLAKKRLQLPAKPSIMEAVMSFATSSEQVQDPKFLR